MAEPSLFLLQVVEMDMGGALEVQGSTISDGDATPASKGGPLETVCAGADVNRAPRGPLEGHRNAGLVRLSIKQAAMVHPSMMARM